MDRKSIQQPSTKETHEVRECPGCYGGLVYDTVIGAWADHDGCLGTGRARVFVYPKTRRCSGCSEPTNGRDLIEVVEYHQSLTFFEGDQICPQCAGDHGVV